MIDLDSGTMIHRATKGSDLTWLANKILELTKIISDEAGYRAGDGQFDDPTSEEDAWLAGDDSGDYLGCAADALSGLRPWMAHDGPSLSDTDGFSLGDIHDLDDAINGFDSGMETIQIDKGSYMADETDWAKRAIHAEALQDWLTLNHPTTGDLLMMMGTGC